MSLITDNQRESAQEPKPTTAPPVPKPVRLQEYDLQPEFEQGQGELGFATEEQLGGSPEPAPETIVEFAEARVEPGQGYLTGLQGQLGQSLPEIPLPAAEAASTPPLTNLWKDATVDLGIPNLGDSRLTTATYPALYNTPFSSFDPGVGNTFVQGANASAQAEVQAQAQARAAQARAIQEAQQRRGALPNTPDASKPWNEQLWGWASDALLGTEAERQQEQQTGKGTFGAYGSGLGGFFKAAFGVPIALAGAVGAEGYGRISYETQKRIAEASNPLILTSDGKTDTRVRYNSATAEQKHQYALSKSGENLLFPGSGNTATVNYDPRRPFGSFVGDALAGEIDDSVSNANPKLPPVIDKPTGKPAQVERPRGLLFATKKRPGQGFFDDPGSAALEAFTQLFSPGNKVDAAGEVLGLGLRALARTNAAKATGRAIVNAVPQPVKQGVGAVANVAKRTAAGVATGTFGQKPVAAAISQPTPVVGVLKNPSLPRNTGAEFEAYLRNQQNGAVVKAPVVPDVPAFDPTTTPVLPKTDPEGLAAVVGIGQKGQPLTFEPTVGLRTHEELVQQVLSQNPEKFGSYRGTTWAEWDAWKKANLSEEDLRQLEAVGAVQEVTPAVAKTPTLDDLQTQARVLAEQKLSVEAPLKQLEEVFDETVDLGRRTVDEVPLRPLTEADVIKALDYSAGLRLSRQLPPSVVQAAARGDSRTFLAQAEAFGGIPGLVQAHNLALEDLSSRITPELVASSRLATDLPPTVYHGTALAEWRPYNVVETGSRGELGSALYTSRSYEEAAEYSRATVGNNRPTEIAYEPLQPQVVEFSTANVQAPLDARLSLSSTDELVQAVVNNLPTNVKENLGSLSQKVSFADLTSRLETAAAQTGGGERLLQEVNNSVADVLREKGYDSVYDPKSGWLAVVDNGKLSVVKQEYVPEPSAVQAAVARYNADSLAAGHYPEHLTSDANLRDSAFQVLDQARNSLDEKLEEVGQALQEATYKEEVQPLVERALALSGDTLKARAKEPPSVERYTRDIQEFGQPLHPVVVREYSSGKFEVVGNTEAYEAAVASFNPRTYSQVAVVVEGKGQELLPIQSIQKKAYKQKPAAATKEEVLKEFNKKTPDYTTAPVVLEETSFGTYRVLDRGYTANAYKQKKQAQVPSVVVGNDGIAKQQLVSLDAIEKKTKALEPEVPKLGELERKTKAADVFLPTVDTPFGSLTAAPENLSKAQQLFSSIESRLSSLGLPTVRVPKIVYVDKAVDAKALQKFVGAEDPVPLSTMNGAYSSKLDALVVNASSSPEKLEPVIVHELMHAFEARLPSEAIDAFRDYIRKSALSKYAPSEYSLKDKGEFMAETAVAVLFGKNKLTSREIPENLKQEFTKAWQAAAAFVQDKPVQDYSKLTELIDKMFIDQMPSFAKDVAKLGDSIAELRKMLDEPLPLAPKPAPNWLAGAPTDAQGRVLDSHIHKFYGVEPRASTTLEDLRSLMQSVDEAVAKDMGGSASYVPQELLFAKGVTQEQLELLNISGDIHLSRDPARTSPTTGTTYPETFSVELKKAPVATKASSENLTIDEDALDELEDLVLAAKGDKSQQMLNLLFGVRRSFTATPADLKALQKLAADDEALSAAVQKLSLEAEFAQDIAAANPHATLTDALDEVQAGKYDICDL